MHDVPVTSRDARDRTAPSRERGALRRLGSAALGALAAAIAVTLLAPSALAATPAPPRDAAAEALYRTTCGRVDALYDSLAGGWVVRGEPVDGAIELGLHRGEDGDTLARGRALRTLTWARALFDSVGGGYYSNAASMDIARPQWDKGTVPNARRLRLLLAAWRATGDERWRRDAAAIADFLDRVPLDGRGGFASGQVADRTMHPAVNGEAIRAWLAWGAVTKHPRQRDFSWISLDRIWSENRHAEFGLVQLDELRQVAGFPRLDDHADFGRALIASARTTGRASDLARAVELGALVLSRFEVAGEGFRAVYQPKKDGKIARSPSEPLASARAAEFLAELAAATDEVRWRDAALRALRSAENAKGRAIERDPRVAAEWALAARATWAPALPSAVTWAAPAPAAKPAPNAKGKRGR